MHLGLDHYCALSRTHLPFWFILHRGVASWQKRTFAIKILVCEEIKSSNFVDRYKRVTVFVSQPLRLVFRYIKMTYLPPANEVWGKVMFLHLCVILFTGVVGFQACITGHMTKGVCIWQGVCIRRGSASSGSTSGGGGSASMEGGSLHPYGSHLCSTQNLFYPFKAKTNRGINF